MLDYQKNSGEYGIIRINYPEKRNAISEEMISLFNHYLEQAEKEQVKFLVLTSTGNKVFCSGGDLNYLHSDLSSEEAFLRLNKMKEVLYKIVTFPVPVICLLNGNALGGGCELATACDIRIAEEGAKFGFVQSNIGILPGWGGGTLLYKKVNPSFALQWIMEAKIFEVTSLQEKGWVQHIVNESEITNMDKLLNLYVNKSYKQMNLLKQQFNKNVFHDDLLETMTEEVRNTASLWGSPKHKQAVSKFLSHK